MRKSNHESETEFAKLLTDPAYFRTGHYFRWAPLFLYAYGRTIEEVANVKAPIRIHDGPDSSELILLVTTRSYLDGFTLKFTR